MAVKQNGKCDKELEQIRDALAPYKDKHPAAVVELYRHGSMAIYIRIVDPDFRRKDRAARNNEVWKYFSSLPEDVVNHISLLALVTPKEIKDSGASLEFDDPVKLGT